MTDAKPDLKPSLIRTLVPFIVGPLVGWLANQGLEVDSVLATMVLSSVAGYLYYVGARFLEVYASSKWGYILGFKTAPVYVSPPAVVTSSEGTRVVDPEDEVEEFNEADWPIVVEDVREAPVAVTTPRARRRAPKKSV